jgi:hypothetical protein
MSVEDTTGISQNNKKIVNVLEAKDPNTLNSKYSYYLYRTKILLNIYL